MKLNIKERLFFNAQFLPKSGGFIGMLTVDNMRKKVVFTPEEIEEFELTDSIDGSVSWDKSKEREAEFEFTDSEVAILKKTLQELDKEEKVTNDLLSICIKVDKL